MIRSGANGRWPGGAWPRTNAPWRVALKHLAGAEAAALVKDAEALRAQLDITMMCEPTESF